MTEEQIKEQAEKVYNRSYDEDWEKHQEGFIAGANWIIDAHSDKINELEQEISLVKDEIYDLEYENEKLEERIIALENDNEIWANLEKELQDKVSDLEDQLKN